MSIKRCRINGRCIQSLSDLYDRLGCGLALPEHFGRNLDALWDVLSTDIEGPLEIIWQHADESKKMMGRDYSRVVRLFERLEKERDDFRLQIDP
ncbi:MAG: barnase inhibitor [Deltaproteobacteria bacterium]|nr:barnase inhibitor [Deltaproteobacteria bacterium]